MRITDIVLSEGKITFSKEFEIKKADFENSLKGISYQREYSKSKARDSRVESTLFPPFNYAFYIYLFEEGRLPTPTEFIERYISLNDFEIRKDNLIYKNEVFPLNAFIGKMYRAYPSIARDFHFYLMLKEFNDKTHFFTKVSYSCEKDYRDGLDIILEKEDAQFSVSLFTKTYYSKIYKEIKTRTRHKYEREIQLPLDFSKAKKIGDIFLYDEKSLWIIIDYVKKGVIL